MLFYIVQTGFPQIKSSSSKKISILNNFTVLCLAGLRSKKRAGIAQSV